MTALFNRNKFYVKRSRSVPRFASKFLTVVRLKILPIYPKNIHRAFELLPRVENKLEEIFSICYSYDIENPFKNPKNLES